MMKTTTRSFTTVVTVISVLMVAEAVTFLFAALLHVGIPLGFAEPRIIPVALMEGLCGLLLAVSTCAVVAHLVAVVGVLPGIIALALGAGPSTVANAIYHRVILGVLIVVLVGFRHPQHEQHWVTAPGRDEKNETEVDHPLATVKE